MVGLSQHPGRAMQVQGIPKRGFLSTVWVPLILGAVLACSNGSGDRVVAGWLDQGSEDRLGDGGLPGDRDGGVDGGGELENGRGDGGLLDSVTCEAASSDNGPVEDEWGITWRRIAGGCYPMGCSFGDAGCLSAEWPRHEVTLSSFEMMETEVTRRMYLQIVGHDPSVPDSDPDSDPLDSETASLAPVDSVTWEEASHFCGLVCGRLPTEAEWEYAARGGTRTRYYCGSQRTCLDAIAWTASNSGGVKHPVGEKLPNAYGLRDMLGNMFEWTADWYDPLYYGVSPTTDPTGPEQGLYRAARGGGYSYDGDIRVSARFDYFPSGGYFAHTLGFRCVR